MLRSENELCATTVFVNLASGTLRDVFYLEYNFAKFKVFPSYNLTLLWHHPPKASPDKEESAKIYAKLQRESAREATTTSHAHHWQKGTNQHIFTRRTPAAHENHINRENQPSRISHRKKKKFSSVSVSLIPSNEVETLGGARDEKKRHSARQLICRGI